MSGIGNRIRGLGKTRYEWMLMIILCSFLGYLTENIWNYFTKGYVDNRNMFMPLLIGYGIAILLVYVFFGAPGKKGVILYALKILIFTAIAEIALGYTFEFICGFRFWDYSDMPLHFTPYVSAITSAGFVLIITLFMKAHFTSLMELFKKWSEYKAVRIIASLVTLLMCADLVLSYVLMIRNGTGNDTWLLKVDPLDYFSEKEVALVVSMFFVYSFLGWCMESAYITFLNKKWTNRGIMVAPLCPIYGFGEFIGYKLILLLPKNYILIFVVGTVFATFFEYLVAKFLIWKTGYLWWDYTKRPFNYKGILCLESTLAWGVIAVVEVAFLHEGIYNLLSMVPTYILALINTGLIIYVIGDLIYSVRKFKKEGLQVEENNILKVR